MNALQAKAIASQKDAQRTIRVWSAHAAFNLVVVQANAIAVLVVGVSIKLATYSPLNPINEDYEMQQRLGLGVPVACSFAIELFHCAHMKNRHHYTRAQLAAHPVHFCVLAMRAVGLVFSVVVCMFPLRPIDNVSVQAALGALQWALLHAQKHVFPISSDRRHPVDGLIAAAHDAMRLRALRNREMAVAASWVSPSPAPLRPPTTSGQVASGSDAPAGGEEGPTSGATETSGKPNASCAPPFMRRNTQRTCKKTKRRRDSMDMANTFRKEFEEMDTDGSGLLDHAEIKAALKKKDPSATDEDVAALLAWADKDGKGAISFDEYVDIVRVQAARAAAKPSSSQNSPSAKATQVFPFEQSSDEEAEILQIFDALSQ